MTTQQRKLIPTRLGKPRIRKNPKAPFTQRWTCELTDAKKRCWVGNGNTAVAAYEQLAVQIQTLDRMGLLWEVFP